MASMRERAKAPVRSVKVCVAFLGIDEGKERAFLGFLA